MTAFRYVGAAGALLALAAPAAARAAGPACGATITSSVRLTADLRDCPADGLVIGADGITVDLNHHTIDGTGNGAGVRLTTRHAVRIKNGTIKEFARGIDSLQGTGNVFEGLTSTANRSGIAVTESTGDTLRLNNLSRNTVTGALIFTSANTKVLGNRVYDNAGNGIAFVEGSTGNLASANDVRGAETGLIIDTSDRNTFALNHVSQSGDGVLVAGDQNTVTGNIIDRAAGCETCGGFGIGITSGTGNQVKANVVTRSASDGINVQAPTTLLALNLSTKNAGIGINAVQGVKDGGRNRSERCVGVVCR